MEAPGIEDGSGMGIRGNPREIMCPSSVIPDPPNPREIRSANADHSASQYVDSPDEKTGRFSAELSIWDAFDAWEFSVTPGDS